MGARKTPQEALQDVMTMRGSLSTQQCLIVPCRASQGPETPYQRIASSDKPDTTKTETIVKRSFRESIRSPR